MTQLLLRDAKVGDQVQITVKIVQYLFGESYTIVSWGNEEFRYYNYRPVDKIIPVPWEPKVGELAILQYCKGWSKHPVKIRHIIDGNAWVEGTKSSNFKAVVRFECLYSHEDTVCAD